MVRPMVWLLTLCMALITCAARAADDAAQALLDKATETKLTAESMADLNEVIKLCEQAIEAGLDDANKQFASEMLASSLTQRADLVCMELFERPVTPNQGRKLAQLALSDLEKTIQLDAEQGQAQYLVGRLYAHMGEKEKGMKALDEAVRLTQDDPPTRSRALMVRANLKTEPAARQADYDEAVKLQPSDPDVLRFRGMFYLTENNLGPAITDLTAAVKLDPKDPDTQEALGIALSMAQKYDEAMESFNKAIELDPEAASAYTQRARVRAIKGDSAAALNDVELALRLQPGSVQALQLHATLLGGAGKYDQALADLNLLRKAMPDNAEVLLQIAMLYQASKEPYKAITAYNQVLERDEENVSAYRGRADVYLSLSKQADAIADYEKALKIDPKNSGVLNNLAWVLATSPEDKLRDGRRAVELAKEACDITEYKQAHILSTLAAGYAETGDFDTAINWSKKAVEVGPDAMKGQLGKELESYQGQKPWREETPPVEEPEAAQTARPDKTQAPSEDETAGRKRS